ncbi:MAG TPA: hypothetical protein VM619_14840 [Luteimonas sp.]|nr:hypothetical protein [Luteimonas sp.]
MASVPVQEIVDALADALRGISTAAGYNTDLGASVVTERSQTGLPTVERCTVACVTKHRGESGGRRPDGERLIRGIIEFEVPATFTNALAHVYRAEEDIDRCLRKYHQMPGALAVVYDEAAFLDRPEGMPVCAAEIHWSTSYRRTDA